MSGDTLSAKTAGRSMPSSAAAQARPSRCRSQPCPTVASRRSLFCSSTASRSRRSRVCRSHESSVIARTQQTDCSVTGLMFSVRPSPNSLPHYTRRRCTVDQMYASVMLKTLTFDLWPHKLFSNGHSSTWRIFVPGWIKIPPLSTV